MTANELKELRLAAKSAHSENNPWYSTSWVIPEAIFTLNKSTITFITHASPAAVLFLLDEVESLKNEVFRLEKSVASVERQRDEARETVRDAVYGDTLHREFGDVIRGWSSETVEEQA